ncbi:DNA-binding protein [Paraburkholderia youngii]|uniref:DNA-binding protein n=1 Tax=Paraburkholderia youngii TaxID=2782701 RepID=UPI001590C379|nr:DNA-binding protein [Paraburkholderia youngii]NUX57667.1 hypothetical protein [Paraburkholderia youngii]
MSRTPLHSPAQVRAAVDSLLAEGGLRAPLPAAQFRRAISVRRLRDALGGGDHARLARMLRELEQQYAAAAHGPRPLPTLPDHVANLMERTWQAAADAAEASALAVKEEAARAVAAAQAAREDADVRVDLLRRELSDLSTTLEARNRTIGELRAQLAAREREAADSVKRAAALAARLAGLEEVHSAERRRFETEQEKIRNEYEGLRLTLLARTDAQRQETAQQRTELERHLRRTEQLLEEVTRDRDRLKGGLHEGGTGSTATA